MPYAARDLNQVMGIGGYVGEVYEGPDGQLYEVVEGVDGLGNPIGISLRKIGKGLVRGVAARLIPGPVKRIAKQVCNFLPRVGPVVSLIPDAKAPYAMANRFCGVLRRVGIAGPEDGIMEVPEQARALLPNLSSKVPAQVRSVAKTVCGVVNKLSPLARFVPPIRPYASGAATLCNILKATGIAGAEGEIMEAPDGQLYEVVEGIGEFGERKRLLRPVWVSIPAVIRPRRSRRTVRPVVPGQPAVLAPRPGVPVTQVVPGTPVVPAPTAVPVRRFR